MARNVIAEAQRCLNCKNPKCKTGCPVNTPIPQFISAFLRGDMAGAGKMLFENNPLSLVCGIVCDHPDQCQGHCIMGIKSEPVEISAIERFISAYYLDSLNPTPPPKNGKKVAVVGAGPAGIAIAIRMAMKGYGVTVFESKTQIGGVLRYGIPDFRLPKNIIDQYQTLMERLGIAIRCNVTIGKAFGIEELFRDGFEAISIGTGVTYPIALNIRGETLGHVHYGVHFLEAPDRYTVGKRVAIIGAGNVAMDVARTVLRRGAQDVKVLVRSDRVSAIKEEYEYAKIEGAKFLFYKKPVEITEDGVLCVDTQTEDAQAALLPADMVLICISQKPSSLILTQTHGLEINEKGLLVVDEKGRTTRKGVFAAGDVIKGAKTVVEAIQTAKTVADAMHEFLSVE